MEEEEEVMIEDDGKDEDMILIRDTIHGGPYSISQVLIVSD